MAVMSDSDLSDLDSDLSDWHWNDLPPLTDAQVRAGALPGESWKAARERLEAEQCQSTWPELRVDDSRPDYLRPLPARPCKWLTAQRFAELQAQWKAERDLTPRERFNRRFPDQYWPTYAERAAKFPASELDWVPCAASLPDWRDTITRYWVHTAYDQRLTVCRYEGNGMWSRGSDGSLLSGARHWRIALDDAPATRLATREECYALARLSRLHKLPPFEDAYDDGWPWHIHMARRKP